MTTPNDKIPVLKYWIRVDYLCYKELKESGSIPADEPFEPVFLDGTPVPREIWEDMCK